MYEGNVVPVDRVRPRRTADQVEIDRAVLAHIKTHVEQTGTAWAPLLLSEEWATSVLRLREREDIVDDPLLGGLVPASARSEMRDKQSRMLSYIKWRIDTHNRPIKLRVLTREKAQAVVRLLLTGKLTRLADGTVQPTPEGNEWTRPAFPVGRVKD